MMESAETKRFWTRINEISFGNGSVDSNSASSPVPPARKGAGKVLRMQTKASNHQSRSSARRLRGKRGRLQRTLR